MSDKRKLLAVETYEEDNLVYDDHWEFIQEWDDLYMYIFFGGCNHTDELKPTWFETIEGLYNELKDDVLYGNTPENFADYIDYAKSFISGHEEKLAKIKINLKVSDVFSMLDYVYSDFIFDNDVREKLDGVYEYKEINEELDDVYDESRTILNIANYLYDYKIEERRITGYSQGEVAYAYYVPQIAKGDFTDKSIFEYIGCVLYGGLYTYYAYDVTDFNLEDLDVNDVMSECEEYDLITDIHLNDDELKEQFKNLVGVARADSTYTVTKTNYKIDSIA